MFLFSLPPQTLPPVSCLVGERGRMGGMRRFLSHPFPATPSTLCEIHRLEMYTDKAKWQTLNLPNQDFFLKKRLGYAHFIPICLSYSPSPFFLRTSHVSFNLHEERSELKGEKRGEEDSQSTHLARNPFSFRFLECCTYR